jgi:hypothetical protein
MISDYVSVVIEFPEWARSVGQADPQEIFLRLWQIGHVDDILIRALGFTPMLQRADALPPAIQRALESKPDQAVITIPLPRSTTAAQSRAIVEHISGLSTRTRVVAWEEEINIRSSSDVLEEDVEPGGTES